MALPLGELSSEYETERALGHLIRLALLGTFPSRGRLRCGFGCKRALKGKAKARRGA